MLAWRISVVIAVLVFAAAIVVLIVFGFRKNVFFKSYVADDNFKKNRVGGTKNRYFLVLSDAKKYIKRYVIRRSAYDNSFICNFNQPYKTITYYIICYGFNNEPFDVIEVTENNTNDSSKIIALSRACKNVNVVIKSVEGVKLNTNVIKPLSLKKIRLYSLVSGVALMNGLYVVRHILLELILGKYCKPYLGGIYNLISMLIIILITVLYYFMSVTTMRKRNCRNKNGGTIEYEYF